MINNLKSPKNWDLSFISSTETTAEVCPDCGCENDITCDGTGVCSECGHTEMLPCSACSDIYYDAQRQSPWWDMNNCDWNSKTRCTPFPGGKPMTDEEQLKFRMWMASEGFWEKFEANCEAPEAVMETNTTFGAINGAFHWAKTPEGSDFWHDVHDDWVKLMEK